MIRETTFAGLAAACLIAAAILAGSLAREAVADHGRACLEDQPCWNWAKMGNHKRGVVLKSGRSRVVGVFRFAKLDAERRIDWRETPRLPGDRYARRLCRQY